MRKLNLVRQLTLWLGTLLLTIALHAPMVTAIAPPTRTLAQATAPEPTAPEPTNPESTEPDTANEPPTWAAGLAQYQQGHPAAAIAIWSAALASARATGDVAAAQQLLGGIGAVHLALEQYDPAITHLQAALALAEQQDQAENQAQLLSNLGIAYRALGSTRPRSPPIKPP